MGIIHGAIEDRTEETNDMANPNIIFIMSDDMGFVDLSCYGAKKISTPNMDRIAAEGIRFRDAHSPSAVCTPSRYGVVTGRYCWRTWLKHSVLGGFGSPLIEPDRPTVGSFLKQHGYTTASVGKWHLGLTWTKKNGSILKSTQHQRVARRGFDDDNVPVKNGPTTLGFDYSFNISGSLDMAPYCFIENDRCVDLPDRPKEDRAPQQRPGMMSPGWRDDLVDVRFAEKAVAFIDRYAGSPNPFFLYLTPAAPHRPNLPPDFAAGKTKAGSRVILWIVDWWSTVLACAEPHFCREYAHMVTSDNGIRNVDFEGRDWGHKPNGDWRGQKADIWEGGHREPFVARWPGYITPGSTSDQTFCLVDLFATCADIVGAELPNDAAEDSFSVRAALVGEDNADEPIVRRHPHSAQDCFGSGRMEDVHWLARRFSNRVSKSFRVVRAVSSTISSPTRTSGRTSGSTNAMWSWTCWRCSKQCGRKAGVVRCEKTKRGDTMIRVPSLSNWRVLD